MNTRRSFLAGLAATLAWCGLGRDGASKVAGEDSLHLDGDGPLWCGGYTRAKDAAGGLSGLPALGGPGEGFGEGRKTSHLVTPSLVWADCIYGIGCFSLWEYKRIGYPFYLKEPPRIEGCQLVDRRLGFIEQSLASDGVSANLRQLCFVWEQDEKEDRVVTEFGRFPTYIQIRKNIVECTISVIPGALVVDYDRAGDVIGVEIFGSVRMRDFMGILVSPMGTVLPHPAYLAKFSTDG